MSKLLPVTKRHKEYLQISKQMLYIFLRFLRQIKNKSANRKQIHSFSVYKCMSDYHYVINLYQASTKLAELPNDYMNYNTGKFFLLKDRKTLDIYISHSKRDLKFTIRQIKCSMKYTFPATHGKFK